LSIYWDLLAAHKVVSDIAETLLRASKAAGTSKGSNLDARLLHEYQTACLKLEEAIKQSRSKRSGDGIAKLSAICLNRAWQIAYGVALDHPEALWCTYLQPGELPTPKYPGLLKDAMLLGVSTESILVKKRRVSQSTVNRGLHRLEDDSYISQIDVTHCARTGSREKLIIADGEGITWCQANGIDFKLYRYDYKEGGHVHHLITNYFAYTTRQFQVVLTYYGFRDKFFPISSRYGGRCNIEPDLRGLWSDIYSQDVYLPAEVETSYKPEPFIEKVHKYECSKVARVILVTNDQALTEKYRLLLGKITPVRSKYATPTSFELYTIVPLSLKKKEEWSTLKPAGSVIVG
jgi:hypothetical protein